MDQEKFKLKSEFKPKGSQPEAIKKLVSGLKNKSSTQTLLGVTGSGKTFTMANVISKINKPTLVIAHNKTLAAVKTVYVPSDRCFTHCLQQAPGTNKGMKMPQSPHIGLFKSRILF